MLLESLDAEDLRPDDFGEFEGGFAVGTEDVAEDGPHQLVARGMDAIRLVNSPMPFLGATSQGSI